MFEYPRMIGALIYWALTDLAVYHRALEQEYIQARDEWDEELQRWAKRHG